MDWQRKERETYDKARKAPHTAQAGSVVESRLRVYSGALGTCSFAFRTLSLDTNSTNACWPRLTLITSARKSASFVRCSEFSSKCCYNVDFSSPCNTTPALIPSPTCSCEAFSCFVSACFNASTRAKRSAEKPMFSRLTLWVSCRWGDDSSRQDDEPSERHIVQLVLSCCLSGREHA